MDSKSSDLPPLCINNCGFFGSAQWGNYCSVCAKKLGIDPSKIKAPPAGESSSGVSEAVVVSSPDGSSVVAMVAEDVPAKPPKKEDRCAQCNKKLRLALRFPCKCGDTFCREHLIPTEHACPFDHKSSAKSKLAESNPVVKSDRITDRV
jgi:hypothetical protein